MADDKSEWDALMASAAEYDKANEGGTAVKDDPATEKEPELDDPEPGTKEAEEKAKADAQEKPKEDKESAKDSSSFKEKSDETTKQAESDKPKSKWQQNEERKAKTWAEINAEKERFREEQRQEREKIARERQEWEQRRMAMQEKYRDQNGFTADEYRNAADRLRADGKHDLANAAEQRARAVEQAEQETRARAAHDATVKAWDETYRKYADKIPEIKDVNSDAHKAVLNTLNAFPLLKNHPQGLEYAIRAYELEAKARDVDTKDSTIKDLQEKLTKLEKKLSIGPGAVESSQKAPKGFDQMSSKEQAEYLRQQFEKMDE